MPHKKITKLKDAIRATHGCESLHVESVPVVEQFENKIAWQGTVEVFDLIGHPKAKRAYAWSYRDGDQNKTIAVLGVPPVDSPQSAVKVEIVVRCAGACRWREALRNLDCRTLQYKKIHKAVTIRGLSLLPLFDYQLLAE